MGIYDSSRYRVVPLVGAIQKNQRNFDAFLRQIHTEKSVPHLICPDDDGAYFCGAREKSLKPTKEHLKKLVRYIATKDFGKISEVSGKRADLYGKNGEMKRRQAEAEAIRRIDGIYDNAPTLPKAWYIFEGATNPDIYIEGDDFVIVCEGKWTESHITTKTTHLNATDEQRNQMVRHIQGALNSTNKRVYAFYIVDGNCDYTDDLKEDAFRNQLDKETVALTEDEKERILSAFYGYTTWQELESVIPDLVFLRKDEILRMRKP